MTLSFLRAWAWIGLTAFGLSACQDTTDLSATSTNSPIVPKPRLMEAGGPAFTLRSGMALRPEGPDVPQQIADYLSAWLKQTRDLELQSGADGAGIDLILDPSVEGPESYRLDISRSGVVIRAGTGAGLFYGVQSLLQLIDPEGEAGTAVLPALHIEDEPRFAYRGFMLDVSRHLFPVEFIKSFIDLLAQYKLNRFHWHLTDDQGWRVEIKRYPKLQEVAAYRPETLVGHYNDQPQRFDGTRYGGFYTQEEVREIVAYAEDRYITIIPEIELPGHASAAIAAYPELGCTGEPIEVATLWGIHEDIFCPTEETFAFLEGVLTEVMELFPSPYIHIGGDEAPKAQWEASPTAQAVIRREGLADEQELQSYFIRRIEQFLNANGRQIIGWDEILEGGLAPNATVMSWRGTEGGIEAARQGHDVIMTPTSHLYFDYYQSDHPDEPLAIGGFLPIEKVYAFEPVPPSLSEAEAEHIIGTQANLWTEYIPDPEKAEYMAFPRALALAEVAWTPAEEKDLPDFTRRLALQVPRLQALGVAVADKIYDLSADVSTSGSGEVFVSFSSLAEGGTIRYTLDGTAPTVEDPPAEGALPLRESGTVRASHFLDGQPVGRPAEVVFFRHRAAGRTIELTNPPAAAYSAGGPTALINGVRGSESRYGDAEWLGFEGEHLEAVIDLGEATAINEVGFRFFNGPGQWIYPPRRVALWVSDDGEAWTPAGERSVTPEDPTRKLVDTKVDADGAEGRFLKVLVENFGEIPAGLQGAGHRAWLFVDEITVE